MIPELQSVDPERLGKKEWSSGSTWISLREGNWADFMNVLGAGLYQSRGSAVGNNGVQGERKVRIIWNWGYSGQGVET